MRAALAQALRYQAEAEQRLAELRAQNEAKAKAPSPSENADLAKSQRASNSDDVQNKLDAVKRERADQHDAEQEQAKLLEEGRFPKEERSVKPRALRAIADDGNVLKSIDWILKRGATAKQKDDFLRAVPRATKVDLVSARL